MLPPSGDALVKPVAAAAYASSSKPKKTRKSSTLRISGWNPAPSARQVS
jgi:hypothetical protein